jgi:acetyl esterase/lipase
VAGIGCRSFDGDALDLASADADVPSRQATTVFVMEIRWLDVTDEQRAQARGIVEMVEQVIATMPPVHTVAPAVTRRQRAEGTSVLPAPVRLDHAVDRTIAGPAGEVAIRMVVPDEVRGVYLHIHGGGWTLGGADQQDALLDFLATRLGVAVVSVEYRLAPEHPYPAGPDDCEAVAAWLVENARREFGSDRLLIGGESAGAHLSAVTLLRMRDRHQAADRFLAANLVFGMYDFCLTPSVRRWGDRNLVLSTPIIEWFAGNFLGAMSPAERQRPDVSPLYADLAGLPPAFFTVGELDPLVDDSLFMASRWHAAGNEAQVLICPESLHGFIAFPHDIAELSLAQQADFLERRLALAPA